MKYYDGLDVTYGTHTVRVHVQDGNFKGYIDFTIGGNCKGKDVLNFDFEEIDADDIARMELHNLEIKSAGDGYFYIKIHDDNHMDWTDGEYEAYDLDNMIVGIEIVSFEPEG